MGPITVTQVRKVLSSAVLDWNVPLIDACNRSLWEADRYGMITALTPSVDMVRAAYWFRSPVTQPEGK